MNETRIDPMTKAPTETRSELIQKLLVSAVRFRNTAVVDSDFGSSRDEFDTLLYRIMQRNYLPDPSPTFATDVAAELARARKLHPRPTASAHEGYGVILEELDELWDQVKLKASKRDHRNMYEECVQIAAMAQKMAEDLNLKAA